MAKLGLLEGKPYLGLLIKEKKRRTQRAKALKRRGF